MFAVAYKQTMAGAKRIIHEAPEPKFSRRGNVISLSLEWQRRQEERRKAEAERKERSRRIIAEKNAHWAASIAKVK